MVSTEFMGAMMRRRIQTLFRTSGSSSSSSLRVPERFRSMAGKMRLSARWRSR